jgi:hypothetical protein
VFKIDKTKVFWRENDDEIVLLDIDSGDYYTLNSSGAFIWKKLAEDFDENQIINAIVSEYNIEPSVAKKDLNDIILDFTKEKLLK